MNGLENRPRFNFKIRFRKIFILAKLEPISTIPILLWICYISGAVRPSEASLAKHLIQYTLFKRRSGTDLPSSHQWKWCLAQPCDVQNEIYNLLAALCQVERTIWCDRQVDLSRGQSLFALKPSSSFKRAGLSRTQGMRKTLRSMTPA